MSKKLLKYTVVSFLFVLLLSAQALAVPSVVVAEGQHISWKIGTVTIWRFPAAQISEVAEASNRFNALYRKGFGLSDLRVVKKDNRYSLNVKDNVILSIRAEHGTLSKASPNVMGLTCMSRIYEAVGTMHAHQLTPKYKLRGGYEVNSSISWYGGKFIGRKFANGERFTDTHLSAAAKHLPFGTLVKITTPATGKSVVVRITDRFGEHKNRALDISQAAADILGIKRMGVARANVKVIGRVDKIGGR